MIRTALIAWVATSVPFSILLGRMCRVGSLPLPPLAGRGGEPLALVSLRAGPAR